MLPCTSTVRPSVAPLLPGTKVEQSERTPVALSVLHFCSPPDATYTMDFSSIHSTPFTPLKVRVEMVPAVFRKNKVLPFRLVKKSAPAELMDKSFTLPMDAPFLEAWSTVTP